MITHYFPSLYLFYHYSIGDWRTWRSCCHYPITPSSYSQVHAWKGKPASQRAAHQPQRHQTVTHATPHNLPNSLTMHCTAKLGLSMSCRMVSYPVYVNTSQIRGKKLQYHSNMRRILTLILMVQVAQDQGYNPCSGSFHYNTMRRLNAGVRVGNDRIGVLLYADDVEVMSELADESTGCSRWLWERLWS